MPGELGQQVAREALVQQAIAITKGRNLDLYGIYDVNEAHIRSLSHAELLLIVEGTTSG